MIGHSNNTYAAPGLGRALVVHVVQNGQTFLLAKNEVACINEVLQVENVHVHTQVVQQWVGNM